MSARRGSHTGVYRRVQARLGLSQSAVLFLALHRSCRLLLTAGCLVLLGFAHTVPLPGTPLSLHSGQSHSSLHQGQGWGRASSALPAPMISVPSTSSWSPALSMGVNG